MKMLWIVFFLGSIGSSIHCQKVDIMAIEFYRKYNRYLDVGQCVVQLNHPHPSGQNQPIIPGCSLPKKEGTVQVGGTVFNDTRNFQVTQVNDIFVFLGLCSADSASKLGLLQDGDCLAVCVASNLTFSQKAYTRAYVEFYRHGLDVHQEGHNNIPPEFHEHFRNAYFLRDRTYGILEIIVVEMRFQRSEEADHMRKDSFDSLFMSEHMQHVQAEVGAPRVTKVIRVSSSENDFQIQSYNSANFDHAIASVRRYELDLFRIRHLIPLRKPHLMYGIQPYILQPRALGLQSDQTEGEEMMLWESTAALEVRINRGLIKFRQLRRWCQKSRLSACSAINKIRRQIKDIKTGLHQKRAKWSFLPQSERSSAYRNYSAKRRLVFRQMRKLGRRLVQWRKSQRRSKKKEN